MALGAYLTTAAIRTAMRARVESQLVSAASLLARSGFALTPTVIGSVRAIAEADVVALERDGSVVVSTLDTGEAGRLAAAIAALEWRPGSGPVVLPVPCETGECYAALDQLVGRPDLIVAVVDRGTELAAATRGAAGTIAAGALLGLVLLVGVSQVVARRVTAPIERLVAVTRSAGEPDDDGRAEEGPDEVGRRGTAFNRQLGRLAASRQALVRSEKLALAGLFAARVAHDVRNPLSSIKMQTQLLQQRLRTSGDDRTAASLTAIASDVQQVESVVRDLLEVARPGEVRRHPGDLNALVRRCLDQVADRLAYRKIVSVPILDASLPPVPIDADRLQQAILNVVNNAADAMPAGGRLTVTTRRAPGGVALEIADDGEGVPESARAHVFDPFFTTRPDGVGLGLVNARSVVEHHGGAIALEPAGARGTRVTITLPLVSGDARDG